MASKNIIQTIIVDDEEPARLVLREFLTAHEDIKIIADCANGFDAVKAITESKPDLVILDIMMPDVDGYTVQSKMLENDNTRSIPIIILTAKGQMKELFGMASNVAAYIEKPFDPKILKDKVNQLINKNG